MEMGRCAVNFVQGISGRLFNLPEVESTTAREWIVLSVVQLVNTSIFLKLGVDDPLEAVWGAEPGGIGPREGLAYLGGVECDIYPPLLHDLMDMAVPNGHRPENA